MGYTLITNKGKSKIMSGIAYQNRKIRKIIFGIGDDGTSVLKLVKMCNREKIDSSEIWEIIMGYISQQN